MIHIYSCFIAGTDTGVGKTRVTTALVTSLRQRGLRVIGMKPVATGCIRTPGGLRNADAELIRSCNGEQTPYSLINPYAFAAPVAPLFAARSERVSIEQNVIETAFQKLVQGADAAVVEGVGGWRMPLGPDFQLADVVRSLQLRVILVVGLRLGCINHAILSAEAIRGDGLHMLGWVANQIDPQYERIDETLDLLSRELQAPLLGRIPYAVDFDCNKVASCFDPVCWEVLAEHG